MATTETITSSRADRERATTAGPLRGAGQTVRDSAAYVVRQLAGCLVIVVLVWLAVMLYRHLQPVALVLAALVLVFGGAALFVRNRSISRAD